MLGRPFAASFRLVKGFVAPLKPGAKWFCFFLLGYLIGKLLGICGCLLADVFLAALRRFLGHLESLHKTLGRSQRNLGRDAALGVYFKDLIYFMFFSTSISLTGSPCAKNHQSSYFFVSLVLEKLCFWFPYFSSRQSPGFLWVFEP